MTNVSKKSTTIQLMFDRIAPAYDFLNSLLSMGCDRYWRNRSSEVICSTQPMSILDVCCGTGEFSRALERKMPSGCQLVSCDFSEEMLKRAGKKCSQLRLLRSDCMALPFDTGKFDVVTAAWGIRNVEDRSKGLYELFRVCKTGGTVCILEFFPLSANPIFSHLFLFYFKHVLPIIGSWVSREQNAYKYLPASVAEFPTVEEFKRELVQTSCAEKDSITVKRFMSGIAVLVTATKTKNGEIA